MIKDKRLSDKGRSDIQTFGYSDKGLKDKGQKICSFVLVLYSKV
jgi:hypothetical protein